MNNQYILINHAKNHSATKKNELKQITLLNAQDIIKSFKFKKHMDESKRLSKLSLKAKAEGDKNKYEKYEQQRRVVKSNFEIILLNGIFNYRNKEGLEKHFGLVQFDFDHLSDEQNTSVKELREKLIQDEHIIFMYESPSGNGLKGAILTDKIIFHDNEFKLLWDEVTKYFKEKHDVINDKSCKDVCRISYLAHDPDVYYNSNAKPLHIEFKEVVQEQTEVKNTEKEPQQTESYIINGRFKQSIEPWIKDFFENYCLNFVLPSGKHKGVEKNLAIYLYNEYKNNPESYSRIKKRYLQIQRNGDDTIKNWEKEVLKHKYPQLSPGEIASFINDNKEINFKILSRHHYGKSETDNTRQELTLSNLSKTLSSPIPETEWIINGMLPESSIGIITGQPGDFKSWFCQYVSVCVVCGKLILDKQSTLKSSVLYIDEENGLRLFATRLRKILKGANIKNQDVKDFHFLSYQDLKVNKKERYSAETNEFFIESIVKIINDNKIRLIVLDSLVRLIEGEENSSSDMKSVYDTLKAVIKQCPGISFLIIHHNGKSAKGTNMGNMRGSSDLAAMASVLMEFKADPIKRNHVNVSFVKHREIPLDKTPSLSFVVEDTHIDDEGNNHGIRFNYLSERVRMADDELLARKIIDWIIEEDCDTIKNVYAKQKFTPEGYSEKKIIAALKFAVKYDLLQYVNGTNGRMGYKLPDQNQEELQ